MKNLPLNKILLTITKTSHQTDTGIIVDDISDNRVEVGFTKQSITIYDNPPTVKIGEIPEGSKVVYKKGTDTAISSDEAIVDYENVLYWENN